MGWGFRHSDIRHSGASRNLWSLGFHCRYDELRTWIPACAGMTGEVVGMTVGGTDSGLRRNDGRGGRNDDWGDRFRLAPE